jgi:Rieske Fe-S protein
MKEYRLTRREFIDRAIKSCAAAAIVPLLLSSDSSGKKGSPAKTGTQTAITLDFDDPKYAALKNVGGAVYMDIEGKDRQVIVYRLSEDEVTAFSSKCTHAGCKVELPKDEKTVCKCHNSVYDGRGKRMSGPASKDLESYDAKLEKNGVVVSVS